MKSSIVYIAAAACAALSLASCGESKFKVSGNVEGAEGKYVVLEKSDFDGRWVAVDSAKVGGSGQFSISAHAPAAPEIYRLTLGDRYIYLPVDSVEQLQLSTTAAGFGTQFTLSGTDQARNLAAFEKELMQVNHSDPQAMNSFKRQVYTKYIQDSKGSIVGYYLLTKTVNGNPLFDPSNPDDAKYYAAVSTQFEQFRPNDPHGQMLKETALKAMRNRASSQGKKMVIEAEELKVLDLDLPDPSGKNVKLSDVVGKGKPVVVVFSMMNEAESPAVNRDIAQVYNSKGGRVQFYQVSLDKDVYAWREAVANLPWINVIDAGALSDALTRYNVTELPAFFLYDANGELRDRAADAKALSSLLSAY